MRIVVLDTLDQFNKTVALMLAAQLNAKPDSVLGMATGTTTKEVHEELNALVRQGVCSLKEAYTFNVDIRWRLPLDHPTSGWSVMKRQLWDGTDILPDHCCFPDSNAEDPQKAMDDFVAKIASVGGLDLQVLPLGENGHVGFCQPGTLFGSTSLVTQMVEEYRTPQLAEIFGGMDKVPMTGLTLGLKDIMQARQLLFIAKTTRKADIIPRALYGPVTEDCPASMVQLHPNVTVVLDKDAASKL